MSLDFFEIERVIEELAKAYPAQCTTTWFKIIRNHKPTVEQYRSKVVEYMKQFRYLLETYPQSPETDKLKELVNKALNEEIEKVLQGSNSGVERRYKHYVDNSPSEESKNPLEEKESLIKKCYDSTVSPDLIDEKKIESMKIICCMIMIKTFNMKKKQLIILNVDAKRSLSTTINRKWEQ